MAIKLKRLADIYTGFTIRESVRYLEFGDTRLLQSKDLPKDKSILNANNLTYIDWRYDSDPQYLKKGAVVILARGEPEAYVFHGNQSDKVIVGHIFIVINLQTDKILPEFLAWFINYSSVAKYHFEVNSKGTILNMTSISTVRDLPLIIPSKEEQQEILARSDEAYEEAQVFKRLIQLRQEYNHAYDEALLKTVQDRQLDIQI